MVSVIDFFFRPLFSGLERTPDRPAPRAFNIIQDPKQTLALPAFFENIRRRRFELEVERPNLLKTLGIVQGFFSRTFKTPKRIPKSQLSRAARFQPLAKGTRFSIDPFTGKRVLIGFGPRASPKTRSFFGDPSANLLRVQQGNLFRSSLNDLIGNLQNRIRIIDTKSV